ncbi:hypothetical protein ACGFYT_04890 [Streptomyces sp. NPDC048208]|uniref:hypothetical protein n=1 Tax=Streptomyces sp. NPDC048208 TaxID=3365515 RepID=UPI0037144B67
MSDIARPQGRPSELEVSQIPEVAELATALTTLFNGLGIPQQRYAARISMDKSTVSRYLNGRRVANQDFINRLFTELERHRETGITDDVRSRVHRLRLKALKVSDPQAFEVENLRDEVDRSHRTIKNLRRQQEALELLLDQKEDSAREAHQQLELLRGDWVADRIQNEATFLTLTGENQRREEESESLRVEIEDLRRQLSEVNDLRRDAEDRCTELKHQLSTAEEKLAERLRGQIDSEFPYSPADVTEQVLTFHAEERFNDAARLLSLAAAHFNGDDTVSLWRSISRSRRGYIDAIRFLDDAVRFGSVDSVASMAEAAHAASSNHWPSTAQHFATSIASSRTVTELLDLYNRWCAGGPMYGIMRVALPIWSETATPDATFKVLSALKHNNDSTIQVRILHAYGTRPTLDVVLLTAMYSGSTINRRDEVEILIKRWWSTFPLSERHLRTQEWNSLVARHARGKVVRLA